MSERSILHCHRVLSEALKRAVQHRLIPANPCLLAQSPKPVRREVQALSEAQTVELIQAAAGSWLYAPVLVAVTTGVRLGELLGLVWQDVDLAGGRLVVRRSVQRLNDQVFVLNE